MAALKCGPIPTQKLGLRPHSSIIPDVVTKFAARVSWISKLRSFGQCCDVLTEYDAARQRGT